MKKLAWLTAVFVYVLMVWGNMVSATGSGLACPDWPLCHGTVTPPARFDIILEWGHRVLAAIGGVLIITTIISFWRLSFRKTFLKGTTQTLLGLLMLQVLLGGVTVLLELSITISTIHLLIANLVFGGMILLAMIVTWEDDVVVTQDRKVKAHATAVIFGLFVQLALGALVRHGHAGLACSGFPGCLESFWPLPFTFETAVAFTHRWWGVLLLGSFAHLWLTTRKSAPALSRWAGFLFALSIFQVLMGIGTVMSGLGTSSRGIHAAIGYALGGISFFIAIRAGAFRFLWDRRQNSELSSSALPAAT